MLLSPDGQARAEQQDRAAEQLRTIEPLVEDDARKAKDEERLSQDHQHGDCRPDTLDGDVVENVGQGNARNAREYDSRPR